MIDFLIPVYIDHPDRKRNYEIVIDYLHRCNFNQIYIFESFKEKEQVKNLRNVNYFSKKQNEDYFNKMKAFNYLAMQAKSKLIALYDVDVLVKNKDINLAKELLIENKYDIVYPYNGYFYNIPKEKADQLHKDLNTIFNLSECKLFNPNSRGGAVIFNKDVYFEGGLSNEYFKNVGYDDDEIFRRFEKLGYRIGRTDSPLFHLDHHRGDTSFNYSNYIEHNKQVFMETYKRDKEQLKKYINTWEWNIL